VNNFTKVGPLAFLL